MRPQGIYLMTWAALLAGAIPASAQRTSPARDTMKGATIEVIQSYKPEVRQATRPAFTPGLPPADTARPVFRYEVPAQSLQFTYHSQPLRPLALDKDTAALPLQSYVKAGAGNLSTIMLEAGAAQRPGRAIAGLPLRQAAAQMHLLSQKGDIRGQQLFRSGLEAGAGYDLAGHVLRSTVHAGYNRFNQYGFNHEQFSYPASTLLRSYLGIGLDMDLSRQQSPAGSLDYNPSIQASLYRDNPGNRELNLGFELPFARIADSGLSYMAGVRGRYTDMSSDVYSGNNYYLQAMLGAAYQNSSFGARLDLYPTLATAGQSYLLPDASVWAQLPRTTFRLQAGWQARLRHNTFESLSQRNPFLLGRRAFMPASLPFMDIRQTRTDEVYAMLEGHIGDHLQASVRTSWWQFKNLPMFMNNYGDGRNFYLAYDPQVRALSLSGAIRYQVGRVFAAGLSAAWYGYDASQARIWHEPGLRLRADLSTNIRDRFTVTGYASLLDQIYALDQNQKEVKLKTMLDLGLEASYQIVPRIGVFAAGTNLLNIRYERWLGYEAFGINIMGGLRVKF